MEDHQIELKKELNKIRKSQNRVEYKSPEFWELTKKEIDLKEKYLEEHGKESLVRVLLGKQSNFAKLSNSKGNGYGNL